MRKPPEATGGGATRSISMVILTVKTRSGGFCQGPAIGNGRCRMHGGRSTGPITCEGLERSRKANWRHGHYSAEAGARRRAARADLRVLRDLLAELRGL